MMSEGANTNLSPNRDDMMLHLHALFGPSVNANGLTDGRIEIAWTDTDGDIRFARHFSYFDLAGAADFAVRKNSVAGQNVYVGAALRHLDAPTSARSSDHHFLGALHAWSDLDADGAVVHAIETMTAIGLRPTHAVYTGTIPSKRAQVWFTLTSPCTDPERLRRVLSGIQKRLKGDEKVVNPSRLMRLGGTISYPPPVKVARGYVVELTRFSKAQGVPVSIEQLEAVFCTPETKPSGAGERPDFDKHGRRDDEVDALLHKSREPGHWHNSMLSAVATLIGRGYSDWAIRTMCAPYCSGGADDPDLTPLIAGGRKRWDKPNPGEKSDDDDFYGTTNKDGGPRFPFETIGDLRKLPPARYLVDKWIPENAVGILYGKWGSGKSFISFDLALHLVYGLPDWHGAELPGEMLPVLVIAREGHQGFVGRVDAFKKHHGIKDDADSIKFMRANVSFMRDEEFKSLCAAVKEAGPFRLVMIDTVARVLPGVDMNEQQTVTLFMERCKLLAEAAEGTAIGVHHQNKSGGMMGSVFFEANADFVFEVTREGEEGTLERGEIKCTKMKDGADGWKRAILYELVQLGLVDTSDGSLVVKSIGDVGPTKQRFTRNQKKALDALEMTLADTGKPVTNANIPASAKCASIKLWRANFQAASGLETKSAQVTFRRAMDDLLAMGNICVWTDYAWIPTA